jgi:acyl-CoA synthetase (AMP-forming)/AMP-acid ligase II
MHTSSQQRIDELTRAGFWGDQTLHGLLQRWARETPAALAVADQPNRDTLTGDAPRRLDFQQLDRASDQLALALLERGVGADDRLLVQLPNVSELVVCYYALSKLGAVVSPLPVQYGAHELGHMAASLQPAAMLTVPRFRDVALAAEARAALPELPVWTLGADLPGAADDGIDAAGARRLAAYSREHAADANAIITICWTSGTTGTPKGVPRSHNMWLATARNTMAAGDYRRGETLLAPFPLVNMAAVGGFLFPAALAGDALVLHHPLDPALFLAQLQDERVNFTIAPPALLNRLAQQPALWQQFDFSALRAFGSGSAPLAPAMIETIEGDYGKPIINFYGSNEGISLFSTPATAAEPAVRASMFPRFGAPGMPWQGIAHESVRSKVIDPDTGAEITASGQPGELCFAGATVFDGYLEDSGAGVFTADGYFRTGDLVEICGDPPHYYRIAGRCKDIINRGGMKISPSELDTLLEGFPGLAEAAVCAYPDADLGERICACIVPAAGAQPPALDAVNAFLLERGLARFKLPERLEVFDALPRNPMGKVIRSELQHAVSGGRRER